MARGHISQRSHGTWTIAISAGRDPATGRRRRVWRTVRGNKKQAEAELTRLKAEYDRGITPGSGKLTVGQWLTIWLRDVVAQRNRPRTLSSYRTIVDTHLRPVLDSVPLTKLEPNHIDEVVISVRSKGRSANTALHVFTVMRKALADAERRGLVNRNVCRVVQAPRVEPYKVDLPDMKDILEVLVSASTHDKINGLGYDVIFQIAYRTGLRRGELLGINWRAIDFQTGVLSVTDSVQIKPGGGISVETVKSAYSRRAVALDTETLGILRSYRARQAKHILMLGGAYDDHGTVFANEMGGYLHPDRVTSAWRRVATTAGIAKLRFHDLRHGHAAGLIQAGVHAKVVQERLGHASAGFTLQVYGHVAPGIQAQAADAFAKLISTSRN